MQQLINSLDLILIICNNRSNRVKIHKEKRGGKEPFSQFLLSLTIFFFLNRRPKFNPIFLFMIRLYFLSSYFVFCQKWFCFSKNYTQTTLARLKWWRDEFDTPVLID